MALIDLFVGLGILALMIIAAIALVYGAARRRR
jgi:hypothetical protein